ncbi:MAG: DUF3821 domain-containing protein [Methanospirillum sp.]|nr:DUF3821 domain-containing protein [Methanospirillum sp.]
MNDARVSLLIILIIFLSCTGVQAADNIIPREGTVFVGEYDLDISNCDVKTGDEIAFWSSGSTDGVPDSRAKVMDARHFFVDPSLFSGKTGTWYGLVSKKEVFKVEDPWIQFEVVENGIDHEPEWIKQGNLVSFKISTNLGSMKERTGSAGAQVSVNLTGPNGTEYTMLDSPNGEYNLNDIYVYYTPFDTGAIWETENSSKYPEGEYTAWASCNVNQIGEKNAGEGVTTSAKSTFTLSKVQPEKEKDGDKKSSKKDQDVSVEKSGNSSSKDTADEEDKDKSSNITGNETGDREDNTTRTPVPTETEVTETETPVEEVATLEPFEITEEPTQEITPNPTKKSLPSPPKASSTPKKQPMSPIVAVTATLAAILLLSFRRR